MMMMTMMMTMMMILYSPYLDGPGEREKERKGRKKKGFASTTPTIILRRAQRTF
jgi:hypothetical protein